MAAKKFDSPLARLNRAKGQKGKGLFKSPGGGNSQDENQYC